ncbi:MAG: ComF family protein [Nitrospirae bacterium]|nr:ComF family protein [Nitrospirota bacterium]
MPYSGPACQVCGKPLISDVSIMCGECISDKPPFKSVRSFGVYDGALKEAINLLKYYGIKRLSKPLSDIMFRIKMPQVDALLPVPLYKRKLRQREFNQSAIFARHLSDYLGAELLIDCLVKVKETMPQVGLSAKERAKNIRGAFEVENKRFIQGKTLMLVDDVFTTGATVRECSKVLKRAGARDVHVVTLAHGRWD